MKPPPLLPEETLRRVLRLSQFDGMFVLLVPGFLALTWAAEGEAAAAFAEHRDLIAGEVLAVDVHEAEDPTTLAVREPDLGFGYSVSRVS